MANPRIGWLNSTVAFRSANTSDPVEEELRAAVERSRAEFDAATPKNRDERKERLRNPLFAFQRYIDERGGGTQ
jgi:hypothetical protein